MNDGTRDEKRDEMSDRLSSRFGDEEDKTDKSDKSDNTEQADIPNNPDNLGKSEKAEKEDNTDDEDDELDPKEAWTGRMVYVPDGTESEDMLNAFDGEYDRLQYETDWDIRKQLHYYPVLIKVGVDEIEAMDGEEFTAIVEDLSLR